MHRYNFSSIQRDAILLNYFIVHTAISSPFIFSPECLAHSDYDSLVPSEFEAVQVAETDGKIIEKEDICLQM